MAGSDESVDVDAGEVCGGELVADAAASYTAASHFVFSQRAYTSQLNRAPTYSESANPIIP